jgi:hypothetical protein
MDDKTLLALAVLRGAPLTDGPSLAGSVEILTGHDAPLRVQWKALLASLSPEREAALADFVQPLAEAVAAKSSLATAETSAAALARDLLPVTRTLVAQHLSSPEGVSSAQVSTTLSATMGTYSQWLSIGTCDLQFRDPLSDEGPGRILCVAGDDVFGGLTVDQVSASIEPMNWPKCNASFHGMRVLPGSFHDEPDISAPDGSVTRAFRCAYEEKVELLGVVVGDPWTMVEVRTRLSCRHWTVTAATGALVEAGMTYQLDPNSTGDGVVTFDSGRAVVTDAGGGQVRVVSLKEIRFAEVDALDALDNDLVHAAFCSLWSTLFDITVEDCVERTPAPGMRAIVIDASDHPDPQPGKKIPSSPGHGPAPLDTSWLIRWIGDLADYSEYAIGVATRESQRLEQRRSSSEKVTTEALFYDSLETWEANRPSLREGIDLWVRLLQGGAAEPDGPKPERPRIDDVEFPDDLTRQNADFIRTRTTDYLEIGRNAATQFADGTYERADLVADIFDVWGRLARDWTDGLMRGVRTANRWADDTPVPQDPRRRVSVPVDIISGGRTLSLGCNPLKSDASGSDGATHWISPADVEITPNPLRADEPRRVTVSVNASGPKGTYSGELLVFDDDPREPLETVSFSIALDGRFERR